MERGNGTTEEKEKGTKEKVSEQTEKGSVWQADEWNGVCEYVWDAQHDGKRRV